MCNAVMTTIQAPNSARPVSALHTHSPLTRPLCPRCPHPLGHNNDNDNDNQKQAREAHVSALKDIRRAAGAERDSHVARVRYELETLRRRARRSVRKERKRSRAYKAQAIEAHQRGQRTRQVLQSRASALALAAVGGGGGGAPAAPLRRGGFGEPAGTRRGERIIGRTPMDCTSSTFGAVGCVLLDPGFSGKVILNVVSGESLDGAQQLLFYFRGSMCCVGRLGSGRDWSSRGRCLWRALAILQAAS